MATKTISIMNDVYELLVRNRMDNESFSDALRRTFTKSRDIMELAGAWSEITDEETESMKKKIRKVSRESTETLIKRFGHQKK